MSKPAKILRTLKLEANYKMTNNRKTASQRFRAGSSPIVPGWFLVLASLVVLCSAGLWLGESAGAQTQSQQNGESKSARPTDLARENLGLVAASATDISMVLQQEPGLMVDLKEWIARDATNQGQVLADSDLTDLAVLDRLQTDVRLRSVATTLLRKYGYLQPRVNPDSSLAEEQKLVIQERAKWVAQDEEQERLAAGKKQREELARERGCTQATDPDCPAQSSSAPGLQQTQGGGIPGGFSPQQLLPMQPQFNMPSTPNDQFQPQNPLNPFQFQMGNPSQPSLIQTRLGASDDVGDSSSGGSGMGGMGGGFGAGLSGESSGMAGGGMGGSGMGMGSGGMGMGGSDLSGGLSGVATPGLDAEAIASMLSGGGQGGMGGGGLSSTMGGGYSPYSSAGAYQASGGSFVQRGPELRPYFTQNYNVGYQLVRKLNPYPDLPSLYDMYIQASPHLPTLRRFGLDVFENGTRDMQLIPMDMPAGPDYVVGPGDGLSFDMWGGMTQRFSRVVDREGRVSLPEVGPVMVSGKKLSEVQDSVQQVLRSQFKDVSAAVSLTRLRTIRVYVVGDVERPGAYDISALSTPMNALFEAGGPTARGSLRTLRHMRGAQDVQDVDVYDMLLHGVRDNVAPLENGDSIMVPPLGPEVTMQGMVRRPAIYELHGETNLAQTLDLAGGILPIATLRHIEVQRLIAHEKRTMLSVDIPDSADPAAIHAKLEAFNIQDGDTVRIFPIADYNEDVVYLEGHVLRPGKYSYRAGMHVTDVVGSFQDTLPEPDSQYAEIIHLEAPDYRPEVTSFVLSDALKNPTQSPILQPMDTVRIYSRFDFENPPKVSVVGEVRRPGTYLTTGQIHLSDAVHLAGGLSDEAESDDAQVFRYLPDGNLKIFSVSLKEAMAGDVAANIDLAPRDRLLVHRKPAAIEGATVYVEGEVGSPGRYPLTTNMKVADLIHVGGGLKASADVQLANLTQYSQGEHSEVVAENRDLAISAAMAGDPTADLPLHNGDVLTVRELPGWQDLGASIAVRGEVVHAGTYGIRPGERLSSVLERAGGFQPDAYPYGAILQRDQVRELESKSRDEMVRRIRDAEASVQLLPDTDTRQKEAKAAVLQQWQNTLDQLANTPPVGRMNIRISSKIDRWKNSLDDVTVRAGDTILIPKRPSYVMVEGQVFSPSAVAYRPGKSARWYLSQSGGPTKMADKKDIFVIRADGSVIGSHGTLSMWSGQDLNGTLAPGDAVVVPERSLGISFPWANVFQSAQVAASVASTVFIALHP
jgi:polysaccharide biosynthesis/export protein